MDNGNDKRTAAHAVWSCKDDASADAMANKACRKKEVRFLLDQYLGVDPTKMIPSRDDLAAFAWSKAQQNDGDAHKWASMVAQVMGYNTKPAAPPAEEAPAVVEDDSNEEFDG